MAKRHILYAAIVLVIIAILFLLSRCSKELTPETEDVVTPEDDREEGEQAPAGPTLELCKAQNTACEQEQQQAYEACNEQYKDDHDATLACWDEVAAVHGNVNTPFTCSLCKCVCSRLVLFPAKTVEENIESCSTSYTTGHIDECGTWFDWAK